MYWRNIYMDIQDCVFDDSLIQRYCRRSRQQPGISGGGTLPSGARRVAKDGSKISLCVHHRRDTYACNNTFRIGDVVITLLDVHTYIWE